jgi:hypothetical protein
MITLEALWPLKLSILMFLNIAASVLLNSKTSFKRSVHLDEILDLLVLPWIYLLL